jgi:hypothetical protein
MNPNQQHRLDPAKIILTAEHLVLRVSDRFTGSTLAGLAADLLGIARVTDERARLALKPNLLIRGAGLLVGVLGALGLWYIVDHIQRHLINAHFEFGNISDLFQAADAGFNILVALAGALWFLVTLEARVKRKQALAYIGELLEFIQVIDVTQLYYTPELYKSNSSHDSTPPRFDHTYLLFCIEMLGLIGNLAPLYNRGDMDDTVWRATSDVVMLANVIEGRLFAKSEAIRLENDADACRASIDAFKKGQSVPFPSS